MNETDETDDELRDDINLRNVLILMTCVTKDDDKFYPQILLEVFFVKEKHGNNI